MTDKPSLYTILSPRTLNLYNVTDSIVVVIDVFRATSTIATVLYNGATKVIPVDSVDKCIAMGQVTANSITAGERDGKVVEGLQHGNSPAEYPRSLIEGKTLILTTTNGTKLLHMALEQGASEVITGSFPNLSAICTHLIAKKKNILLGCAGWKDRVNLEDMLFAGAVIERVREYFTIHCDSSLIAENIYTTNKHNLNELVRKASHWHRLAQYGLESDMEYCMSHDVADVLPVYDNGELRVLCEK